MIRRRVFYSFHYAQDSWRAATVRNIGVVEGNRPATDNNWEQVKRGGETAIKKWIADQMRGRSCTIVLVGAYTAGRRWINYEIRKSWEGGKGLAGIRIHDLLDQDGFPSDRGSNPFDRFTAKTPLGNNRPLSGIVPLHEPPEYDSRACYAWIRDNLAHIVEEALRIRSSYP